MADRVGVYPGSFNPPTIAHVAIAAAAREQRSLDRVVFVVSRSPINKEHVDRPLFEHRVDVLRTEVARYQWLDVEITEARLLVDIARGYDVLVMGADKWAQVNDPEYYDDDLAARDHVVVSSSEARAGSTQWMAPAARAFDRRTGAWSDPDRYEQWLHDSGYEPGIRA
ncbi:MAG: hypothetical protein E6G39_01475 [Actinobacteria bacterium]|nr:MAG: hypothetical protein E6G39_01475 [Actinomycetota bacterium]